MWLWMVVACQGEKGAEPEPEPEPEPACGSEIPYDGLDQDCSGADLLDVDGDGFDSDQHGGDDCDDADAERNPDAADSSGDGADQNCDGLDGVDQDRDGYASVESGGDDCDDGEPFYNPGADEVWYDGIDGDCDGLCDFDQDGDGAVLQGANLPEDSVCNTGYSTYYGYGYAYVERDCNDTNPSVTQARVFPSAPSPGDILVPVQEPITFQLLGEDPTLTVTLTDESGASVPGTLQGPTGSGFRFVPDAPLAFLHTYQFEVDHACGNLSLSFTTEDEALPVDSAGLVGRTYQLDLAVGSWVEPDYASYLIAYQLGSASLLVEVLDASEALGLRLAPGDGALQETCSPTSELSGLDFAANPRFEAELGQFTLPTSSGALTIEEAHLAGRFQSDSAALVSVELEGTLDTRSFADLYGLGGDESAFCDFLDSIGLSCFACADGTGDFCLAFRVEELVGPEVSTELEARTIEDIAADTSCP